MSFNLLKVNDERIMALESSDITPWSDNTMKCQSIGVYNNSIYLSRKTVADNGKLLKIDGTIEYSMNTLPYFTSDFIPVSEETLFEIYGSFLISSPRCGFCIYDSNKELVYYGGSPSLDNLLVPMFNVREMYPSARYLRFDFATLDAYCIITGLELTGVYKNFNDYILGDFTGKMPGGFINVNYDDVIVNNLLLTQDGSAVTLEGYYTSEYIKVTESMIFKAHGLFINTGVDWCGLVLYDENKNVVAISGSPSVSDLDLPLFKVIDRYPTAKYLRFSLVDKQHSYASYNYMTDSNYQTYSEKVMEYVKSYAMPKSEEASDDDSFNNIITVKANGVIGTDCNFTDIKSALDSISGNSQLNTFLVYVKNGTYDITGLDYLGFKNYVTVRGESRDDVIIKNMPSVSDLKYSCFDPAFYHDPIDYASIENMTLLIHNGKCCVHIDGYDIKSGGRIFIKNVCFTNLYGGPGGGICAGLNGGQTIEVHDCFGNASHYAHTTVNPGSYRRYNSFIFKNTQATYLAFYDISDKVSDNKKNQFIIDNCTCDYIGLGVSHLSTDKTYNSIEAKISNNNRFNYVYFYDNLKGWFTKYPICSSIHNNKYNGSNVTITEGMFVSYKRRSDNRMPAYDNAQPQYGYDIVPYDGTNFYGIALEDIPSGQYGIIQTKGKILVPDNSFSNDQYVTLNSNGQLIGGTKENAIGIVTDANQDMKDGTYRTYIMMKQREYTVF